MAIAIGASAQATTGGATSLSTASITVTGSNTYGLVMVFVGNADSVTCTWNGVSMTEITGSPQTNAPGGGSRVRFFSLAGPTTGVVTASWTNSNVADIAAAYYTGVSQSGFPDSSSTANTNGTATQTYTTTVVASNCWLVCGMRENFGLGNAGAGTTARERVLGNAGTLLDSNGVVGTGAQSLIWENDNAAAWQSGIIVSIAPVADILVSQWDTPSSRTILIRKPFKTVGY